MISQQEQKIAQDKSDLEQLALQVEKISRLKQEYSKQKQQIDSLKSAISDLRNENEELKSQSCKNQKSSWNAKREPAGRQSISAEPPESKKELSNQGHSSSNNRQEESRVSGGQDSLRNPEHSSNHPKVKPRRCHPPEPTPRPPRAKYPGFYSSTARFLSPQFRSNAPSDHIISNHSIMNRTSEVWDRAYDNHRANPDLKLGTSHLKTRSKLVDNLVANLHDEIGQREEMLEEERSAHKSTRKVLERMLGENQKLTEINGRMGVEFEMLEKENELLKQEIEKEIEGKWIGREVRETREARGWEWGWRCAEARKYYEDGELEFLAMDAIYYDFQRIRRGTPFGC